MARRPLHRLASLALLGLLVACGGGGGDPPAEPRERVDFTGRWSIVDNYEIYRSNSNSCLVGEGVQKWTFNVTQDENGKVLGQFMPTGMRPKCAEQLIASGVDLTGTNIARK